MLTDTLKAKSNVLDKLINLTEQQEKLIASDEFDEDKFLQILTLKEEQITELAKLDDGFEKLFLSVKEEVISNSDKYVTEITTLKVLITGITDKSVKIEALEKRNKSRLDSYFTKKRNQIRSSRVSNQAVTNYYKSITGHQETQSYFYDKKK
jgi:hypothetical protein